MINLKFSIYNSLISISDKISILYNSKVDKCLAEVFSIGLTVLSAGTL